MSLLARSTPASSRLLQPDANLFIVPVLLLPRAAADAQRVVNLIVRSLGASDSIVIIVIGRVVSRRPLSRSEPAMYGSVRARGCKEREVSLKDGGASKAHSAVIA